MPAGFFLAAFAFFWVDFVDFAVVLATFFFRRQKPWTSFRHIFWSIQIALLSSISTCVNPSDYWDNNFLYRNLLGSSSFKPKPFSTLLFIGLVIAFAPVNVTVTLKRQNVRRDAVQEPAIVAGDDHAADVIHDGFFQRSQCIDIQVIGRFVEQQHIGTALQQLRKVDAVSFTTGQIADFFLLVRTAEIETGNVGPRVRLCACPIPVVSCPPEISSNTVWSACN